MSKGEIGTTIDEFTLSVDLAPTILSAAGLAWPVQMQGRDMSILYRDDSATDQKLDPRRKEFYFELPTFVFSDERICPTEALVRTDFKFINWTSQMPEHVRFEE
mmetsp:Transcript_13987/g.20020  ORF Transcript_13987/g.20020 Transcript_13987/m.20020 type:complete len:104 (-) Transcript_13987:224-535(-)